jgi:large subunit ribosomal protein L10
LKGGMIEGEIVSDENLRKIAALPSKTELLTSVVSNLNAPISNLVNYLHQMIFSLVSVINSIKNSSDNNRNVQDGGNKNV